MMYEVRLCEWVVALHKHIAVEPPIERNMRQCDAERLAFNLNIEHKYGMQSQSAIWRGG